MVLLLLLWVSQSFFDVDYVFVCFFCLCVVVVVVVVVVDFYDDQYVFLVADLYV